MLTVAALSLHIRGGSPTELTCAYKSSALSLSLSTYSRWFAHRIPYHRRATSLRQLMFLLLMLLLTDVNVTPFIIPIQFRFCALGALSPRRSRRMVNSRYIVARLSALLLCVLWYNHDMGLVIPPSIRTPTPGECFFLRGKHLAGEV